MNGNQLQATLCVYHDFNTQKLRAEAKCGVGHAQHAARLIAQRRVVDELLKALLPRDAHPPRAPRAEVVEHGECAPYRLANRRTRIHVQVGVELTIVLDELDELFL